MLINLSSYQLIIIKGGVMHCTVAAHSVTLIRIARTNLMERNRRQCYTLIATTRAPKRDYLTRAPNIVEDITG